MILKPICVIILCAGCSLSMQAQKRGFYEGYIVNQNADTIRGLVSDRDPGPFEELYTRIRFIKEGTRRKKKYSANQINGYGYGNVHFESVGLKQQYILFVNRYWVDNSFSKVFLKVIEKKNGLTHYSQEFVDDESDFLDDYPLFYLQGSSQMVRVTQGILGLKRKRLAEYFNSCPHLVSKIERLEINTALEVFDFYVGHCTRQ